MQFIADAHLLDMVRRIGVVVPVVDVVGLPVREVDVDTADDVDELHEGADVRADIVAAVEEIAGLDLFHDEVRTAVAEAVGQPVVLAFVLAGQDGHTGASLKADEFDRVVPGVDGQKDHGVRPGVRVEAGGPFVRTEEQDVDDVRVPEDFALREHRVIVRVLEALQFLFRDGCGLIEETRVRLLDFRFHAVVELDEVQLVEEETADGDRHGDEDETHGQDLFGPVVAAVAALGRRGGLPFRTGDEDALFLLVRFVHRIVLDPVERGVLRPLGHLFLGVFPGLFRFAVRRLARFADGELGTGSFFFRGELRFQRLIRFLSFFDLLREFLLLFLKKCQRVCFSRQYNTPFPGLGDGGRFFRFYRSSFFLFCHSSKNLPFVLWFRPICRSAVSAWWAGCR